MVDYIEWVLEHLGFYWTKVVLKNIDVLVCSSASVVAKNFEDYLSFDTKLKSNSIELKLVYRADF